ncbi:MAG TPA: chemotaxis protein CheW [Desulfuromonadales bacterium]|nr:chemotaxis protein CheW [Desulfuromonadales bacterium]
MTVAETANGEGRKREIQLACFRIGNELYGLDIMRIKEIIRPQKLTPVPKAPRFIEGVINLRGTVIPVADLRKRFDQQVSDNPRKNRILVCALEGRMVGLLVDEVMEVRSFTRQEMTPASMFFKGQGDDFFLGVARQDDLLVMLLDLDRVLSSDEKISLHQIEAMTDEKKPETERS